MKKNWKEPHNRQQEQISCLEESHKKFWTERENQRTSETCTSTLLHRKYSESEHQWSFLPQNWRIYNGSNLWSMQRKSNQLLVSSLRSVSATDCFERCPRIWSAERTVLASAKTIQSLSAKELWRTLSAATFSSFTSKNRHFELIISNFSKLASCFPEARTRELPWTHFTKLEESKKERICVHYTTCKNRFPPWKLG